MSAIVNAGKSLHYEIDGEDNVKNLLMISGVGTQLTWWSAGLVAALVDRGFRVIRMDNRDVGLSDSYDETGIPNILSMVTDKRAGKTLQPPYRLEDMAADAVAVLQALGIRRAHVVGGSMGGMIAQLLALDHPALVASLTSIMSTTGDPALPPAAPEAQAVLLRPRRPPHEDREAWLDGAVENARVLGSPGYPEDPARLRAAAAASVDRAYSPAGFARHYAAILAAPDRSARLRTLRLPVAVIHGAADPLVRPEAGRATAACIPGAEYHEIAGMGHNIPTALEGNVADIIAKIAARA